MKKVECIIRPIKLEKVKAALHDVGVSVITVSENRGADYNPVFAELYRDGKYTIEFTPKVKIEFAVREENVDKVVKAIQQAAATDNIS